MRAVVQNPAPGQRFHHRRSSREGCDRKTATERFAKGHKIGREFVIFLAAAGGDPKAGYSFVENEKNAVVLRELLQAQEKSFRGREDAHVGHDAFGDDGGNLPRMIFDGALQSQQIVPRNHNCVVERVPVQARTVGNFEGIVAMSNRSWGQRIRTHHQVVIPSVIVALELQNFRPASISAR